MAETKPNGLKRSEVLRITAALVDVMEKAKFSISEDACLQKRSADGYMMSFKKEKLAIGEIQEVQKKLGDKIRISVLPCDKKNLQVSLEAAGGDFMSFLKRRDETLA